MVDPDLVDESRPDEVMIATGGSLRRDGFQLWTPVTPVPGHDRPMCVRLMGRPTRCATKSSYRLLAGRSSGYAKAASDPDHGDALEATCAFLAIGELARERSPDPQHPRRLFHGQQEPHIDRRLI